MTERNMKWIILFLPFQYFVSCQLSNPEISFSKYIILYSLLLFSICFIRLYIYGQPLSWNLNWKWLFASHSIISCITSKRMLNFSYTDYYRTDRKHNYKWIKRTHGKKHSTKGKLIKRCLNNIVNDTNIN